MRAAQVEATLENGILMLRIPRAEGVDGIMKEVRDVLSEAGSENREQFTADELKGLKQKLRNLGYLD